MSLFLTKLAKNIYLLWFLIKWNINALIVFVPWIRLESNLNSAIKYRYIYLSQFWFDDIRKWQTLFIWNSLAMSNIIDAYCRDAGGGGAGGARAPQKFGISVNPIRTKGGRLCPPYYYWPPHLFGRCGVSVLCLLLCSRS